MHESKLAETAELRKRIVELKVDTGLSRKQFCRHSVPEGGHDGFYVAFGHLALSQSLDDSNKRALAAALNGVTREKQRNWRRGVVDSASLPRDALWRRILCNERRAVMQRHGLPRWYCRILSCDRGFLCLVLRRRIRK